MSSSSSAMPAQRSWRPALDLTPAGLSHFDPARVQQAVEEGYQAGFDAGRAEALDRGQAAVAEELESLRRQVVQVITRLEHVTAELAAQEQAAADAFASAVAPAAIEVARAIVGRELADDTVAAVAAVERSLVALGRRTGTVVRLHPDDLALVGGAAIPDHVRLEADPSLDRGDATAETDDRTVDARIATALRRALAVLDGTEDHPA